MVKVKVLTVDGKKKGEVELPSCFGVPFRPDLIRRVVRCHWFAKKQPQGRDPLAGKRNTAESWGTGYATARVPRLKGSGYPSSRNAAFAPGTVGGRLAHPPKAEKNLNKKVNKKEKSLARKSAIAATGREELVRKRGHRFEEGATVPIVVDDKVQTFKSTKQVREFFKAIGVWSDVERAKFGRSVRAGKGKRRGRKYKRRVGPLVVISEDFGISRAARNLPGVDVVHVRNLSTEDLAPGARAGRLVVWTESSVKSLD
ncbi:MAG: 50S ribosomal protein L4 [Promethearchaeota archaeon]